MRLRPLLPLALAAVVLAAACGSDNSGGSSGATTAAPGSTASATPATPGEKVTLRLGYFPNITHATALVGVETGHLRRGRSAQRRRSRTATFNAGPDAINALFADADRRHLPRPQPGHQRLRASRRGAALRIISGATSGGAALVVKPDINSAADLKGKTLATPQLGNTQDVALRTWLKDKGSEDRHQRRRRRVDQAPGQRADPRRVQAGPDPGRLGARAVGDPPGAGGRRQGAGDETTCGRRASSSPPTSSSHRRS